MLPVSLWVLLMVVGAEMMVITRGAGQDAARLRTLACGCGAGLLVICVGWIVWTWVAGRTGARRSHVGDVAVVLLALLVAAVFVSSLACARMLACRDALAAGSISTWRFEVVSDPIDGATGYRCQATAHAPGLRAMVWLHSDERLERGRRLVCVGRFTPPSADDFGRSMLRQGIVGTVRLVRVMSSEDPKGPVGALRALRASVLGRIDPRSRQSRAVIAGVVCGSREALRAWGLDDVFAACGLAHLIAISGAHIAVVSALVGGVLERTGVGVRSRGIVLALVSGSFVAFCGAPPSAIRAYLMSLASFGAQCAGRRSHALSGACLAGICMALVDPTVSGQLGFLLSVVSVVALCVFEPYASYLLTCLVRLRTFRRTPYEVRRVLVAFARALRGAISATFVCQCATLPLAAASFGTISLVAPLAGVLVGPLVMASLVLGLAAVCASPVPMACELLLACADLPIDLGIAVARRLSSLPFSSVPTEPLGPLVWVVPPLVLALGYLLWPRVSSACLRWALVAVTAPIVATLLVWRLLAPARIVVLDVGQGDAILVQDGGAAILVDAGPDEAVVAALMRQHVLHLDALVVTHLHDDHVGGVASLVGSIPCEQVVVARGVARAMPDGLARVVRDLCGRPLAEVGYGDELDVGRFSLKVVWPHAEVDGADNEDSLELLASFSGGEGSLEALLTGDAEQRETERCVASGDVGDIDLLKVGHHGSEVSLDARSAEALHAELAVASAAEDNPYGHPHATCVRLLEDAGTAFLCTRDVGDVDVRPSAAGPLLVRCTAA